MSIFDSVNKMIAIATGSKDPVALNAVMEVQKELIRLQEENRQLREELHEVKNQKIMESELEIHGGVYLHKPSKRTYCSTCWDSGKKLISVYEVGAGYYCGVCEFSYAYTD